MRPKTVSEAPQEESNLGSGSASVEMRLVDDEKEPFLGVLGEPLPSAIKDWSFQRPHEHVLEHRVVGDEQVWWVRKHFVTLRGRGVFDSALIVVTSDHGKTFFEEGRYAHGLPGLNEQIHVPLLIKMPGQRESRIVEEPVQSIDILPTILNVVGIPPPKELPGSTLRQETLEAARPVIAEAYFSPATTRRAGRRWRLALTDQPLNVENVHQVRPSSWTLIEDGWKLILVTDGGHLLYNLASDPRETSNLFTTHPERARRMEERLRSILPATAFEKYLAPVEETFWDRETLERLRSLGYIR